MIRRMLGSAAVVVALLAPLVILYTSAFLEAAEDKVAFLAAKLKETGSFKVRLKAAVLLGRMADPRAVSPLVEALNDESYVVRGASARALGNLGHPVAVSAVQHLLRMMTDEEHFVRKEAMHALKSLAGERSLSEFMKALASDVPAVRLAAVRVLAGMSMPEARRGIIPALGDADEEVRTEVVVSIKGMGLADMQNLLLIALEYRDNYRVQGMAARLVSEMRMTSALTTLADLLVRDDVVPEVKREAAEALASMKDQLNVPALVTQLGSEDPSKRDQAIKLLGIQGSREAVDALLGLLKSQDAFMRRRAVFALSAANDPRAIPALELLLKTEEDPRFQEQIKQTLRKLKP